MPVGGLATDVKIAGRWGIVSGHETNTVLNEPETGHGLPTKDANGVGDPQQRRSRSATRR